MGINKWAALNNIKLIKANDSIDEIPKISITRVEQMASIIKGVAILRDGPAQPSNIRFFFNDGIIKKIYKYRILKIRKWRQIGKVKKHLDKCNTKYYTFNV